MFPSGFGPLSGEVLSALVVFAFVASATPGPNNMMLLASGVNYGFRRTIPHMLGIGLGFGLMILLVGFGVGQLFVLFAWLYTVLKVVSVAYMLWLAWHIAMSGPVTAKPGDAAAEPMTFLAAAAFQWVNPKAWAMCLTAISAYTVPASYAASMVMVTLVFVIVNLPTVSLWTLFGVSLRGLLADARRVRIFNVAMALALVASLWPVLAEYVR